MLPSTIADMQISAIVLARALALCACLGIVVGLAHLLAARPAVVSCAKINAIYVEAPIRNQALRLREARVARGVGEEIQKAQTRAAAILNSGEWPSSEGTQWAQSYIPSSSGSPSCGNEGLHTNWVGHTVSATRPAQEPVSYTSVSGSFVQPSPNRVAEREATTDPRASFSVSTWLGLDGLHSPSLEQVGTTIEYPSSGAPATIGAWYEMVPGPVINIPLEVRPGDHIHLSVSCVGSNRFALSLDDETTGQAWMRALPGTVTARLRSAEWITEPQQQGPREADTLPASNLVEWSDLSFIASDMRPGASTVRESALIDGPSRNPVAQAWNSQILKGTDGPHFDTLFSTREGAP
jgi:hypothetical protein